MTITTTTTASTMKESITIEEARAMLKAHTMRYPDTPDNRKMIAAAVDEVLRTLRPGR